MCKQGDTVVMGNQVTLCSPCVASGGFATSHLSGRGRLPGDRARWKVSAQRYGESEAVRRSAAEGRGEQKGGIDPRVSALSLPVSPMAPLWFRSMGPCELPAQRYPTEGAQRAEIYSPFSLARPYMPPALEKGEPLARPPSYRRYHF